MNFDCMNYGINCDPSVVTHDFYFCSGALLLGFLLVVVWGKIAGYTDEKNNPDTASATNGLAYFFIVAIVGVALLSVLAWAIGKIFGA